MSVSQVQLRFIVASGKPLIYAGAALILVVLIHLAIWLPARWEPKIGLGISLMLIAMLVRPDRAWLAGISDRRQYRGTAWLVTVTLTLILAITLVATCWFLGAWHGYKTLAVFDKSFGHWLSVKLPTVIAQQLMLQLLLVPALVEMFQKRRLVITLGSLLFASLHFPNPALMLLTGLAGWMWIDLYLRFRHLAPIIISHFLLAVLAAGVGGEYLFNLRVGPACAELFPIQVEFENSERIVVFPGAVTGCVERLTQDGDKLILDGWVSDGIHNLPPRSLAIQIGSRLVSPRHLQVEPATWMTWKNAKDSGQALSSIYQFKVSVPAVDFKDGQTATLLAENVNGWHSRLGRMGEIAPISHRTMNQTTLIFPTEVDGRINKISVEENKTTLSGWLADLRDFSRPNDLCIQVGGRWHEVNLTNTRRSSPNIAKSYKTEKLSRCGFNVDLALIDFRNAQDVRFFTRDQHGVMHPIPLTKKAMIEVVKFRSGAEATIFR